MTGAERLARVQERLIAAGVLDVKFFFAPDAFAAPLDSVFNDAAKLLECHLDGRYEVILSVGDQYRGR